MKQLKLFYPEIIIVIIFTMIYATPLSAQKSSDAKELNITKIEL